MDKRVELHVKRSRVMFPKTGTYKSGDFAIVAVKVVKIIEGEPHIHPTYHTITIKGKLPVMDKDSTYRIVATETYESKFNSYSYMISYIQELMSLDSTEDQIIFLSRVLSQTQLTNLVNTYDNPLEVIASGDVEALCKVKGIGEVTARNIIQRYNGCKDNSKAYIELNPLGLTTAMIDKLVDNYTSIDVMVDKVKNNPYILATEVTGVGFKKADEIALKGGMDEHCIERGIALIIHHLETLAQQGNSYTYVEDVVDEIVQTLGGDYPMEAIGECLRTLVEEGELWHNGDKTLIGLQKYYRLEQKIAHHIIRLRDGKNNFKFDGWEDKIRAIETRQGWEFTNEQWACIQATLEHNLVLITGLAGTGKSTTVLGMLEALNLEPHEFAQTALSGRASVNLTDVTGYDGYTIHRLLESTPSGGFFYHEDEPLPQKIIILDELSMVDGTLFHSLIRAIATGHKLIMLGDDGQLESIGVGNIIYDLIECGTIKHCHLTKVHRQASKSAIITESRKIRESEQIIENGFEGRITLGELNDLHLIGYHDSKYRTPNEPKPTIELMVEKYKEKLKMVDNISEICAILPTKTRGSSCYKMNQIIQRIVTPIGLLRGIEIGSNGNEPYTLYKGDRVINLVNDRKATHKENGEDVVRPIFNGNMGTITSVNCEDRSIVVDFDNIGLVTIPSDKIHNIDLAYCVTCHKLQGSSAKYIICGLDHTHYTMQTREMVYTMITRAKKHCDFIFETKALIRATKNTNVTRKHTFLPYLLNGTMEIDLE